MSCKKAVMQPSFVGLEDTYRHCELGAADEVSCFGSYRGPELGCAVEAACHSEGLRWLACALRLQHPPESSTDRLLCMGCAGVGEKETSLRA